MWRFEWAVHDLCVPWHRNWCNKLTDRKMITSACLICLSSLHSFQISFKKQNEKQTTVLHPVSCSSCDRLTRLSIYIKQYLSYHYTLHYWKKKISQFKGTKLAKTSHKGQMWSAKMYLLVQFCAGATFNLTIRKAISYRFSMRFLTCFHLLLNLL